MKKIALTLCGLALVVLTIAQELTLRTSNLTPFATSMAVFKWESTTFDFGSIRKSEPVAHEFTFTNTGDIPLVISSVQASCGCTVTAYTKDPIEPGMDGFVKATYNAAHIGKFSKTVTVNANTDEPVILTIKGEVSE